MEGRAQELWAHKTLCNRVIRWSRLKVFNRIFAVLAGEDPRPERIRVDSTHLKARRTAASLPKKGAFPLHRGHEGRAEPEAPCRLRRRRPGARNTALRSADQKQESAARPRQGAPQAAPQSQEPHRQTQGLAAHRNALRPARPHLRWGDPHRGSRRPLFRSMSPEPGNALQIFTGPCCGSEFSTGNAGSALPAFSRVRDA